MTLAEITKKTFIGTCIMSSLVFNNPCVAQKGNNSEQKKDQVKLELTLPEIKDDFQINKDYLYLYFYNLDREFDRKSKNLKDLDNFMLINRIEYRKERDNENFFSGDNFLYKGEERELRKFLKSIFSESGKQFINNTPELDRIENSFKRFINVGFSGQGGERYVRVNVSPEQAHELLKDEQEYEEVSRLKLKIPEFFRKSNIEYKLKLVSEGVKAYAKIDNMRLFGTKWRIDKVKIELNRDGTTELKIINALRSPKNGEYSIENNKEKLRKIAYRKNNEQGVYWHFSGNLYFNENFNQEFNGAGISIVRSSMISRLELFYEYDENRERKIFGGKCSLVVF